MRRAGTTLGTVLAILIVLGASFAVAAAPLSPGDILVANQGGTVRHYSSSGADLGIFASGLSFPSWITADQSGNIYVTEYGGGRVDKFSPSGINVMTITTAYTPGGVAVRSDGVIYVAHYDAGKIHIYSGPGDDLGIFASYAGCDTGCGTDFIKFDAHGNLYVGDFQPVGRIRLISPTGEDRGNFILDTGVEGMAFDASGNLYVSNSSTGIIERFSPVGADLGAFAVPGFYGLAFDGEGNLYSAASGGPIDKFSPSGVDLGSFGVGGRDLVIVPGPVTKDQCKHGGWKTFAFPRTFEHQGGTACNS